jgi:hypothetical protein
MNASVLLRKTSITTLVLCSALLTGCGKTKESWEQVYPAKGIVNFGGKPVAGAVISLIPQDPEIPDTVRPTATAKEDGTFEIGTYSKADGAPEGKYKVLVLHYPVIGSKASPAAGPNDLPRKYSKAETTDLLVEVVAPNTEFQPLELKK